MTFINRIRNKAMRKLVSSPEEAARIIKKGMTVAVSGYTPAGYPKVIPQELVKRVQNGEELWINLISGASLGPEIDEQLALHGIIKRRLPFQTNRVLRDLINKRKTSYVEIPLGKMSQFIQNGFLGDIDVAVIEALAITEEGYLVPTTSVGVTPAILKMAKEIIVEINISQPIQMEGIHDIYLPGLPPHQEPIPLKSVKERIGEPFMRVDPQKIKYIVESDIRDTPDIYPEGDVNSTAISHNLINFLENEVMKKRLPTGLLPIQSGVGSIANSVITGFKDSAFSEMQFYCGVLQEGVMDLVEKGLVIAASGGALSPSRHVLERIVNNPDQYKETVVLRPADLSNNGEVINRLGIIALNNALEIDVYGNTNTSHVLGSQVFNGIGGGSEFCRNAYLSIMMAPSTTKNDQISTFVPMVTHCDIIEHDIDIIVTDIGVADLRGKDPVERAQVIIANCVNPIYRERLLEYLNKAINTVGGHQPCLLNEAFSWHIRLQEKKTMKLIQQ